MKTLEVSFKVKIVNGYVVVKSEELGEIVTLGDIRKPFDMASVGRAVMKFVNKGLMCQGQKPKDTSLISINKVASMLGLSIMSVRRLEGKGKLKPTLTTGGHRRYRMCDAQELRDQLSVRSLNLPTGP